MTIGETELAWCVSRTAPVSRLNDGKSGALLLGDALPRGAPRRATVADWLRAWPHPSADFPVHDGFHVGVIVRDGSVRVSADLLGLFPVYWAQAGPVLIVSASQRPFACHPAFSDEIDDGALFGHLLTGGPFDGRSVQRGVMRLGAGSCLQWDGRGHARELPHFTYPPVVLETGRTTVEHQACFEEALDRAVTRHAAVHRRTALLLSGGRDSRLLAGILAQHGHRPRAVTLGVASDYDADFASRVAWALGLPHTLHDTPFARFPAFADRILQHERLASGMSSIHSWAATAALGEASDAVVSGYVLEARQLAPLPATRHGMLQWTAAHAMTPECLDSLVHDEWRATVEETRARIVTAFDASGGDLDDDAERSWRWLMAGYARFHPGAVPWRLAFAAWPVLPILDHDLLQAMLSIPRILLERRAMQDALLRQRFPELARIPLDRNTSNTRPLLETRGARVRDVISRAVGRMRPFRPRERRYYARVYDFDNPGWRSIREGAESGRAGLATWFRPDVLRQLVPSPEQRAGHLNPIDQGFAPKMLVGIMRLMAIRDRTTPF